jgi:superfamily II DNA helicase RecQ
MLNIGEIDRQWRSGPSFWIVATSGLMNGVDYGDVVNVIFFEPPFGLLDLVQGGGRAGRRDQKSYVMVLQSDKLIEPQQDKGDYQQLEALNEWLTNGRCRREVFGTVLDGEELSCNMDNRLIKCDVCSKDDNVYKVARAAMGIHMVKTKTF